MALANGQLMELVIGIGAAVALFVAGYALDARSKRRALGAAATGTPPVPPSVYPRVNTDVCICSGACVTACPEGDVLAIVGGRPRLVKPAACVSHGDCLRSCPVNAIELVLGSKERSIEVPIASGTFETTVPGLYTAGEVNGIGRIHISASQGRQAAAAALEGLPRHACELDLVVVGAGPAGLAAGLEARKRGARYVILEKGAFGGAIRTYPRAKIVMTGAMELPGVGTMKLSRASKEELVDVLQAVVQQTSLAITERTDVTGVAPHPAGGLLVTTSVGTLHAARVVLAIGRRGTPNRLGVPGEGLPHVVYGVEEPAAFRGKSVLVVGGGNSAIEVALALATEPTIEVTLVHRGADFARAHPANQRALASSRVRVLVHARVMQIEPTRAVVTVSNQQQAVAATAVVCCLGAELPTAWLKTLGVGIRELRGEVIQTGT